MTSDPKKPDDQSPDAPPVDLLSEPEGLSEDPFSEDYEATVIETAPALDTTDDLDTSDETTEVTQKIAIESPVQQTVPRPAANPKSQTSVSRTKPIGTSSVWQKIALGACVILGTTALIGFLYFFKPSPSPQPNTPPNPNVNMGLPIDFLPPQDHDIQVSSLDLIGGKSLSKSLAEALIGRETRWTFALTHWQTPPEKNLNFHLEVKIFDPDGVLVYDEPQFRKFSSPANPATEEIKTELSIQPKPEAKPGVYRLRLDVVDDSSNKRKTLQTRFRVISKAHPEKPGEPAD